MWEGGYSTGQGEIGRNRGTEDAVRGHRQSLLPCAQTKAVLAAGSGLLLNALALCLSHTHTHTHYIEHRFKARISSARTKKRFPHHTLKRGQITERISN